MWGWVWSEGEDVLGGVHCARIVHVVRSQCLLEGRTACGVIVGGVWYSKMCIVG